MSAVLLALSSAFLFGATTVAMRVAFRARRARGGRRALHRSHGAGGRRFRSRWPRAGLSPECGRSCSPGCSSPGVSQFLFTFAVREAGASRTSVVIGTAPLFSVAIAVVVLDEPLEAALVVGAVLIVAGGFLLVSERDRPEHVRLLGLGLALVGDDRLRGARQPRSLARRSTPTSTPGVAACRDADRRRGDDGGLRARRPRAAPRARRAAFAPAGVLFGLSYVCLFEAYYRGLVTVVSPLVATESLWGVALSAVVLGEIGARRRATRRRRRPRRLRAAC